MGEVKRYDMRVIGGAHAPEVDAQECDSGEWRRNEDCEALVRSLRIAHAYVKLTRADGCGMEGGKFRNTRAEKAEAELVRLRAVEKAAKRVVSHYGKDAIVFCLAIGKLAEACGMGE